MATRVYGASDDLIEFEGDVYGEVGCYGTDDKDDDRKPHCFFSDGTVLKIFYGSGGIWKIELVRKGSLFGSIDLCVDGDDDPHSDVAHFKDGLKWAYFADEVELVQ